MGRDPLLPRVCRGLVIRHAIPHQADDFAELSVARLKQQLREKGLPVSGRKLDLIERLSGSSNRVSAVPFSDIGRRAVRNAIDSGGWQMSLMDWYVRPPQVLPRGLRNPLCDLGECGDDNCALYRLRPGAEAVRPEILDFCTGQIVKHAEGLQERGAAGLVYCSLGCGCLYFDWELLDRLLRSEGVHVAQVWLVERCYRQGSNESGRAIRAREAFARWFANWGIEIHAFKSANALKRWLRAFPAAGQADVLVQCDAVDTGPILDDDDDFRRLVAHAGALNLQAYSQLLARRRPGPGRRRDPVASVPVRRARQRTGDDEASFVLLQEDTWKDGRWVRDHEDTYQSLISSFEEEYR